MKPHGECLRMVAKMCNPDTLQVSAERLRLAMGDAPSREDEHDEHLRVRGQLRVTQDALAASEAARAELTRCLSSAVSSIKCGEPWHDDGCDGCARIQAALRGEQPRADAMYERLRASEAARARLREALGTMVDAVQWMSGANDFSPEGQAHAGWIKTRDELRAAMAALAADASTGQRRCDTTATERFAVDCTCGTYEGNLGPCATFTDGPDARCPYCAHTKECHLKVDAGGEGKRECGAIGERWVCDKPAGHDRMHSYVKRHATSEPKTGGER